MSIQEFLIRTTFISRTLSRYISIVSDNWVSTNFNREKWGVIGLTKYEESGDLSKSQTKKFTILVGFTNVNKSSIHWDGCSNTGKPVKYFTKRHQTTVFWTFPLETRFSLDWWPWYIIITGRDNRQFHNILPVTRPTPFLWTEIRTDTGTLWCWRCRS